MTSVVDSAPADQKMVKETAKFALPPELVTKIEALPGTHPHAVQAITNAALKAEFTALDFLQDLREIPKDISRA